MQGFRFVRLAFAVDVNGEGGLLMGAKKKKDILERKGECFLVKCKEGNENVRRTIRKVCVCVGEIYLGREDRGILLARGG